MQRLRINPRPNWQKTVESQGLVFHTPSNDAGAARTYWNESAAYRFTRAEVDALEKATYALDQMCLAAVQRVIDENLFSRFLIDPPYVPFIQRSWEMDEITLYGRFDFAYAGGDSAPKLLEYNADTPTCLVESAVIQWFWMKEFFPKVETASGKIDQFNSIHERLIEAWNRVRAERAPDRVVFTAMTDDAEDLTTVTYLRDTAMQAHLSTEQIDIARVGWNASRRCFTDEREQQIGYAFKLYPWEWMLQEQFGPRLVDAPTRWVEPPWKMLLSNKAILAVLWEMYPDSPYLLPASFEPLPGVAQVRKPMLGREGANVAILHPDGQIAAQRDGEYGPPFIYQGLCDLPEFDGHRAVMGSWMVNGYACGIGVREDTSPIIGLDSRFVPHWFAG